MNFKKSLTALAVAGIMAPMAAQADLYASARIGLVNTDFDGVADMDVNSVASRMGVKSESDLGNGMTGWGKYEFSVNETGTTIGLRHQVVGLKGDFGNVWVGQTYNTFYNHVVGPMDIPWIGSGGAMVSYTGRTGNALTYAGGSGDISFGATAYFNTDANEDAPDGTEFGVSFGLGGMTLGVAMQDSEAQDDAAIGVALHGIDLGGASLGVGFQSQGDDTSVLIHAGIGNAYVHFESLDLDAVSENSGLGIDAGDFVADSSPTLMTLGYNLPLGPKTLMYFEYVSEDRDTGNSDDDRTRLAAVLKYDIE